MRAGGQGCERCLYTTSHPFGLVLDAEGICTGCRTHEEKERLDWTAREQLLGEQFEQALSTSPRRRYDCVVPVRGGPEYFKVLHLVKEVWGLDPLVVVYNSQFNSEVGIRNLDLLRDVFDVDLRHYTTNPLTYRKLVRESLTYLCSMRWPYLAGETQFPVRVAVDAGIPLVVWPAHQPTEQVGTHSYLDEVEMSRRNRHDYDLVRAEPDDLLDVGSLLEPVELDDLRYPSDRELADGAVRGVYLSNYYPWDTRRYSEEMIDHYGARCARNRRTFDTYDRIDDRTYLTVHDVLKQARLGYSRVTDHLCREIRFGRIGREDALAVERHFQREAVDDEIDIFRRWLGMSPSGFGFLLGRQAHEVPTGGGPELTVGQQAFVDSFRVDADPVWSGEEYILYGKGLP